MLVLWENGREILLRRMKEAKGGRKDARYCMQVELYFT